MKPWIQNVSLADVRKGAHKAAGGAALNSVLIQIVDPDIDFPIPADKFKEVYQFKFLDVEAKDECEDESWRCSQHQADLLVSILKSALHRNLNVIVHCVAGVCRSGAVCEVGVMMGFEDTEVFRSPNLLVKHQMMKTLGWLYDEQEPHTINGVPLAEDWTSDNEKVFILAYARREHREDNEG